MPIYEYACHDCRKVYQFFTQSFSSEKKPVCPKCGNGELERLLSSFAALKTSRKSQPDTGGAAKSGGEDLDKDPGAGPGVGEFGEHGLGGPGGPGSMMDDPFANMTPAQQAAAEREMMKLMRDAESIEENDPRQIGHFMERMMQITGGMGMDSKEMKEAIRRLKAGEDPEKIEEDMGDVLGLGGEEGEGGGPGGMSDYGYDSGLYDM